MGAAILGGRRTELLEHLALVAALPPHTTRLRVDNLPRAEIDGGLVGGALKKRAAKPVSYGGHARGWRQWQSK